MITKVSKSDFDDFWFVIVPYGYNSDWEKVKEIRDWCRENFEKGTWRREDLHHESSFTIDKEEDVALFVMKWS